MQFGLFSPGEIVKLSVLETTVPGTYTDGRRLPFSLNDVKLGPGSSYGPSCGTCLGDVNQCVGHFAHIVLAKPVYHILFFQYIYKTLQQICPHCARKKKRLAAKHCLFCQHPIPTYQRSVHEIWDKTTKEIFYPGRLRRLFCKISDDDAKELGWNPPHSRPEWAILETLLVAPPAVRPSARMRHNKWSCNDMTYKYSEIIKVNNKLKALVFGKCPFHIVYETWKILQWHVSTLFDNALPGRIRVANARRNVPCKGLKQRLYGKSGRIRGNLMGKRVDFSARTVITPDPNLSLDQVGVPKSIALNLTVPERVTPYNLKAMRQRILAGPRHLRGARYLVKKANGGARYDLRVYRVKSLSVGDIVERPLKDDDWVCMNRQPTLHRPSIMAHRVKILDHSTFRLNLSVTTPYNAGTYFGGARPTHGPQGRVWDAYPVVVGVLRMYRIIIHVFALWTSNHPFHFI